MLCQKLSRSPFYFNKTLLHKSSERSSLVSGPRLSSSPSGPRILASWFNNNLSTSWEIDGETVETVSDFISWGSKITGDGDCSHEIKRCLLLWRKVMSNLDSIFKSRDITLPKKVKGCCWITTPGFLAPEGEEFNPGPETRLDHSELLCNKVLLQYKRDRESWHRHHNGTERVPPCSSSAGCYIVTSSLLMKEKNVLKLRMAPGPSPVRYILG